jgi:hypothetical protein
VFHSEVMAVLLYMSMARYIRRGLDCKAYTRFARGVAVMIAGLVERCEARGVADLEVAANQ